MDGKGGNRSDVQKLDRAAFDRSLCRLIEKGHVGVAEYGYSFYVTVSEDSFRLESEAIKNNMIAIRCAMHADEKDWKKIMKAME